MSEQRVVIFIDGSNFYYCMKDELGAAKINFAKFAELLAGKRTLIRTYYYNAPLRREHDEEKYKDQQRFFDHLRHIDYFEVKLGRLIPRKATYVQKGVDVRLAVDMIAFAAANMYDVAVLVSGDGDFAEAVQHVKNIGKHVENAFFRTGQSRDLSARADRFILLDKKFVKGCLI